MSNTPSENQPIAPKLIIGADNIAKFLGLRGRKSIYNIWDKKKAGRSDIPIWHEPGIGLVANQDILIQYMARKSGVATVNPAR